MGWKVVETTFGPGALERIALRKRTAYSHPEVRVAGLYTVYCGMGNDHTVRINGKWYLRREASPGDDHEVAGELVNWELEDWFDPCDVDQEEETDVATG